MRWHARVWSSWTSNPNHTRCSTDIANPIEIHRYLPNVWGSPKVGQSHALAKPELMAVTNHAFPSEEGMSGGPCPTGELNPAEMSDLDRTTVATKFGTTTASAAI